VLVLNFIGYHDGARAEASFAVARTLRAVFPKLRVFRDAPLSEDQNDPGNLLFFASEAGLDFTIPADARFENNICEEVQRSFQAWEVLKQVPNGALITDAQNPLSKLQIPIAEKHFEAMNRLLPSDVWLN
jgi:hypothetical protein